MLDHSKHDCLGRQGLDGVSRDVSSQILHRCTAVEPWEFEVLQVIPVNAMPGEDASVKV